MKHHLRVTICMLVLCAVLFLSGCGVSKVSFLTKDNMEKDMGLIMLRLRIKDPTGILPQKRSFPKFVLQKEGEVGQEDRIRLRVFDGDTKTVWKKEKGIYYFDQCYFLVGRPGRYFIKRLYFDLGSSSHYLAHGLRTKISKWLNVPLYIALDLKNDGLVFIETIDFTLNSVQAIKGGGKSFNYTLSFDDSPEQKAEILKRFQARYPLLSKKYTDHRITGSPFFGFYSSFSMDIRRDLTIPELYIETCVIRIGWAGKRVLVLDGKNPDKNKCGYSTMEEMLALPNTYTIHYQMRWIEGTKDATYGFQIRQNEKNIYYFGATAAGTPIVWIKKDGQWLENPKVNRISQFLSSSEQADDFKIDFKDGEFTYRINDEVASTFKDVLGNTKAKIGFFVSGTQEVVVDSIAITGR